jgi:hypothetical protein
MPCIVSGNDARAVDQIDYDLDRNIGRFIENVKGIGELFTVIGYQFVACHAVGLVKAG